MMLVKDAHILANEIRMIVQAAEDTDPSLIIYVTIDFSLTSEPDTCLIAADALERTGDFSFMRHDFLKIILSCHSAYKLVIGENPEIAFFVCLCAKDILAFENRVSLVEQGYTVKSVEPVRGTDPYITVNFLVDAVDGR